MGLYPGGGLKLGGGLKVGFYGMFQKKPIFTRLANTAALAFSLSINLVWLQFFATFDFWSFN